LRLEARSSGWRRGLNGGLQRVFDVTLVRLLLPLSPSHRILKSHARGLSYKARHHLSLENEQCLADLNVDDDTINV